MFWRNYFRCKNCKTITSQSKFLGASSLATRDTPVAATLQRKSSGGSKFVTTTEIITKENVPRNYVVAISARMVFLTIPVIPTQAALKGTELRCRTTPKRRVSQKTADFRIFTPSPGSSSIWRAQEPQISTENRRSLQITVTLGPSPLARPYQPPIRASPSAVCRAIGKTDAPYFQGVSEYGLQIDLDNRWLLFLSHSWNQSAEPTVLGDSHNQHVPKDLGMGNGVSKQGRGNEPPINDTDPTGKLSIDSWSYADSQNLNRKSSLDCLVRTADAEIQYRHHIADTETIVDAVFADAVSETSRILRYKWEAYGDTNGRSTQRTAYKKRNRTENRSKILPQ